MDVRELVRDYYGSDRLSEAVLNALASAGVDLDQLGPADLYPVDHLHAGGAVATQHVLDRLELRPGVRLLDVGSGLGGPARMAASIGATVSGVDLTPEFVEAATDLTARVGADDLATFRVSSGDSLPFAERSFDAAMMVHVGMNVPDKAAVFREVHRVLAPGARFAVYEQMSTGMGEPPYPLPWATDARSSFLEDGRRLPAPAGGGWLRRRRGRRPHRVGAQASARSTGHPGGRVRTGLRRGRGQLCRREPRRPAADSARARRCLKSAGRESPSCGVLADRFGEDQRGILSLGNGHSCR